MKSKKGFTLIELLIVIAIIGILASIVLVSLSSARDKAKEAVYIAYSASLRSLVEVAIAEGGFDSMTTTTSWRCVGDFAHPDSDVLPSGIAGRCWGSYVNDTTVDTILEEYGELPPGKISPSSQSTRGGTMLRLVVPTTGSGRYIEYRVHVGDGNASRMCSSFGLKQETGSAEIANSYSCRGTYYLDS